jgi:hypothetical protein
MMPGPLAAATYASIKVAGYAGFAYALNRVLDRSVRVWKFGSVKTGIGLICGVVYFFAMMSIADRSSLSEAQVYAGALPIRFAVWGIVLALLYHVPGMAMAIC